jgi:hypothetical protein
VSVQKPPGVDRDGFLDDVHETRGTHLARDECGRSSFLRRSGDAESEWMRTKRLEPLDDVAEVLGGDLGQGRPSSRPANVSETSAPSEPRS